MGSKAGGPSGQALSRTAPSLRPGGVPLLQSCAASASTKWSSLARRTFGEFFPPIRRITIKRARTWHYRKMRPCIEPSNDLAPLSPFQSWLGCITNTSGYDFRKGQADGSGQPRSRFRHACRCRRSSPPPCRWRLLTLPRRPEDLVCPRALPLRN
jgi:hypothetical protein